MAVAHANARQQRLQTLRSDLALKEQELREVRARLADLESTKPAATVDFLTQACKSRKVLDQVPLAQIGNTTALFRTATTEELEKQKLLKRTMAEIELQLKHALAAKARARKEFDRIVEKTGYTTSKLAPSSKLPTDEPELDEFEMRQTIAQMKKNIHAATTLNRTKSNTLGALSTELERRREKQLVVEEELNAVLVVQRQINERKERLHELLTRHARLDARITAAQDAVDQETAALLQLDVAAYKQRSAEVVEARRAEDRVLKAQEARIAQLDDRLKMVRTVLDAHGLLGPVEAVVHELCNAADQRRLDGPSKHVDPAATDAEAPPADAAATEEPNTLDAIVAKYSDIETLAPEYELLPASILSVFQHDLQQHERNLRVKSVMVQEKEDTKLALIAKVKDLQVQHEETVDRVHDLKENNELSIDAHVDSARDVLAAKKAAFDDLLRQNARLSHQIRALQSSAPSRSPSQAPQDAETGDKSSPQRSSSKADDEAAKKPRGKKAKESPGGTKSEDPVQSGW